MSTTTQGPDPKVHSVQAEAMARNLEKLAWLMDRAIPIPGTHLRVGLDAVLGLFPFGGDFLAGLVQVALVLVAVHHYRVPKAVAARMAANVLIDVVGGSIPVLGDVFDAVFKANTRNVALLGQVRDRRSLGEPIPVAQSAWYLVGLGVGLVAAFIALFAALVALAAYIWRLVNHAA
jgi:hypothetical protein